MFTFQFEMEKQYFDFYQLINYKLEFKLKKHGI